jgi:hypothetical protein
MRAFYAAQMRFFRQLCTAAKVDAVVELALSYEANGYAPVIGLQSTGEARTAAYVAAHGGDDETLESFVEPAALVLANWIKKWLPGAQGEGGWGGVKLDAGVGVYCMCPSSATTGASSACGRCVECIWHGRCGRRL